MYVYLLNKWVNREVTKEDLQVFVPMFISQDQYNTIINTSQKPIENHEV